MTILLETEASLDLETGATPVLRYGYKLKLELQRPGEQIAEQWQTTVPRKSSDVHRNSDSGAGSDELIRVQKELQPLAPRGAARWTNRINSISRSGSWAMFPWPVWKS